MLDAMGIQQHHDAVTGTAKQHVANNYYHLLWKAMGVNNQAYTKELMEIMNLTAGISTDELQSCVGAQNSTVAECPISWHNVSNSSVLVVVHNPSAQNWTQLVRIQLPTSNWTAQIWNTTSQNFSSVHADIIKQLHFVNDAEANRTYDYDMYLPYHLQANEVGFLLLTSDNTNQSVKTPVEPQYKLEINSTLELLEQTTRDIKFRYTRSPFGFNTI